MIDYDYQNLKVTAWLRDPLICDRLQPLDGILGAASVEDPDLRQRSRQYRTYRRMVDAHGRDKTHRIFQEKGWYIPPARGHFLPLDVWGHGVISGVWVYCASSAIPGQVLERGLAYINHYLDADLLNQYVEPGKKKILTGKGEFKSEHIPFQTLTTESLTWFVRGIRPEIEEALSITYAVAKKRNRGYGGVRKWEIEEIDADHSVFTPAGTLMRPIPCTLLDRLVVPGNYQYAYTAYRPPYWDLRYACRCAVSGQRS